MGALWSCMHMEILRSEVKLTTSRGSCFSPLFRTPSTTCFVVLRRDCNSLTVS